MQISHFCYNCRKKQFVLVGFERRWWKSERDLFLTRSDSWSAAWNKNSSMQTSTRRTFISISKEKKCLLDGRWYLKRQFDGPSSRSLKKKMSTWRTLKFETLTRRIFISISQENIINDISSDHLARLSSNFPPNVY